MAPTAPKRTSLRPKSSKLTAAPSRPSTTYPAPSGTFSTTKKDKRLIKHSLFINKIEKASAKTKKPRRPNKKLIANLESLTDALPDLLEADKKGETVVGQAVIQQRSLKSKPGIGKRKEELARMERERFGKNLALLVGGGVSDASTEDQAQTPEVSVENRWAALRNFISGTMDKKEFTKR